MPGDNGQIQAQAVEGFPWLALFQLVLSLLGFFGSLAGGLLFMLIGLGQLTSQNLGLPDQTTTFLYAASLAFAGFLLLPSAVFALRRLVRKPRTGIGTASSESFFSGRWLWLASGLLIFLMPLVLWIGNRVAQQGKLAWFLLPPLHILAVTLPIFWLVALGLRGLRPGSGQRAWGLIGAGLVFSPALILVLEIALLVLFSMLAVLMIASQPGAANELSDLMQRLQYAPPDPEVLQRILSPFLANPAVVVAAFVYVVVLVPLIEETFKPIGVWFLAGRKPTPQEGFAAGLLSGAGYALFENLFLSSGDAQWVTLILARVGTGAVHIFTTSLVGWGLASAWGQGRYLRLGFTFAIAVGVHGLWNGLTLFTLGSQFTQLPGLGVFLQVSQFAPFVLGTLALTCILSIWLLNRMVKRAIISPLPAAERIQDQNLLDEG